jgi:membrane fusion protein (multidrug efflux system)
MSIFRQKNKSYLHIAALFVCITALASCGKNESAQPVAAVPDVPVVSVIQRDLPLEIEFIGQTKGAIDADIRTRVEGVLQGVHFQEGREVTEGQLLYTIDPAPVNAKLSEMQARLAEAETKLIKANADYGRIKPLADMNAVSKRDLDTVIAMQGVAKSSVDVAKAGVEGAQIELGYTKIQSPITGIIGLTKARVGEFVGKPPNAVVLNTVSQLDPINVRLTVNEKDYLYFARLRQEREKRGESAPKRILQLILADNSVHPEAGEVSSTDSQIDPTTGSMAVEASFPNPGKIIRPGQFAKVRAQKDIIKGAIAVPKKAVRDLQGLRQVMVVKADNTIEIRTITVKEEVGDLVLVEKGLIAGERILPEVQPRLKSGTVVRPIEP